MVCVDALLLLPMLLLLLFGVDVLFAVGVLCGVGVLGTNTACSLLLPADVMSHGLIGASHMSHAAGVPGADWRILLHALSSSPYHVHGVARPECEDVRLHVSSSEHGGVNTCAHTYTHAHTQHTYTHTHTHQNIPFAGLHLPSAYLRKKSSLYHVCMQASECMCVHMYTHLLLT